MRMSDGSSDLCSSDLLAHELHSAANGVSLDDDTIFRAVAAVHKRVSGAYAVAAQISGYGLLAFRAPHGIRPLCIGRQETEDRSRDVSGKSVPVCADLGGRRFIQIIITNNDLTT